MRTLLSVLVGVVVTVVLFWALLFALASLGIGTIELALIALVSLAGGVGTVVWANRRDARYRPTHSSRAS